jgi:hypothetical protein
MTGFSWGHLTDLNMTDFHLRVLNSNFVSDVRNELLPLKGLVKIFESASYTTALPLENYRRRNVVLRDVLVNQLHFEELDQHQLTAAKLDSQDRIHYAGVPRAMSVIISLNLMCNSHQPKKDRQIMLLLAGTNSVGTHDPHQPLRSGLLW